MEMVIGAYPWTVHQVFDKARFADLPEMRKWEDEENYKFLETFNLQQGERISVQVGGNRKDGKLVWYTGTFDGLSKSTSYSRNVLFLQQSNRNMPIEGWMIADIKRVK